jgi:VWFA-related protein
MLLVCIVVVAAHRVTGQAPPAPAPAPQPAAAPPDQPTFRLGANYVRVDVYPTRGGEPVQDLGKADFELLEDGVPQAIEQFERISLQTVTDPAARRDPNTVAESREQAGDPRRRVFVVFLDTGMTTIDGSYSARKPIVDMLDKLIGYDDLFAVMTPEMSASDIAFARRTEGLDAQLAKYWTWGRRDDIARHDPEEIEIETCFPDPAPERICLLPGGKKVTQPSDAYRGVAIQLIERRSEKRAFDALDDLVSFLGMVREERKAVIVVSQGWRLLEPKSQLVRLQVCEEAPGLGTPGVDPSGRVVTDVQRERDPRSQQPNVCQAIAMSYAQVDNGAAFRDVIERANRFNVSFYPFDTRGLQVFDRSVGARDERIRNDPGERSDKKRVVRGPLVDDTDRLMNRVQSLQTLAEATDGLAVVNTNNLASGARRIVNDLSTYYLLGYQSTNTKLDGKWRNITVRLKPPGIQVRARRGYRALTEKEVSILSRGGAAPGAGGAGPAGQAVETGAAAALTRAIAPLAGFERALPWRSRAAWRPGTAGGPARTRLWVASEIDEATMRQPEWAGGGTWTATLAAADGTRIADTSAKLEPGARSVEANLVADVPAQAEVLVRLRLNPAGSGLPLTDTIRFTPSGTSARLFRSGLTTGRRFAVAGDARFRRSDRLRVALPIDDASVPTQAVLLDRAGTVLKIPVAARVDTLDGAPWAVGELALAPLSPGDYVVRLVVGQGDRAMTSLTGFRIVN